ncbi:MAG: Uma2 family endonuclease [Chloroflexota bacterium]
MIKQVVVDEPVWEIARLFPPQGQWAVDDYLGLAAQSGNHLIEFSHGHVEVLPMPSLQHQAIAAFLFHLLYSFVLSRQLGMVRFAPTKVRLWEGKIREPDLFFVAKENSEKRTAQWFTHIDLAMEIVSPDDPGRDLETKRREYAQAGIAEYWIIDPRSEEILVLTLAGKQYETHGIFRPGETATSVLLTEFAVAVTDVFAQR